MRAPLPLRGPIWAGLVALQVGACGVQLARGFVPLRRAPGRVAYSWDMFAPAVSRCDMRFAPPVPWAGGALASLRQLSPPLEWDLVFDTVASYRALGRALCAGAAGPGALRLRCFTAAGERSDDVVPCP